jgi:2-polyprenyl-6-methoxyphenol hydroxylase-like FAD-dependent oxidoreductase
MLSKLGKVPDEVRAVMENSELDAFRCSHVRYRPAWELLWGNISKGGVCVAGDALHPMTPDIGQGGCAALEDGVVLARCLGEALLKNKKQEIKDKGEEGKEEYKRIEMGLNKYASERKWRCIDLTFTAYAVSFIQESEGKIMAFLRNKFFSPILARLLFKKADFDCGKLRSP